MAIIFFEDIKKTLSDKETFWLNLSILLYIALLPFNAFEFKIIPGSYLQLKFTKIALFFVLVFWLKALMQKKIKIKAEPLLYFFLTLQILANFLSIVSSPNKRESLVLAAAISQYSILIFVLINALRTESLLKSILTVMGTVILVIVGYYLAIYILRKGVFHSRVEFSLLGNKIAHYLNYVLLMFGTGLLYLFFNKRTGRVRIFLFISVVLWLFVTIIPAVKIFQIAMLLFLSLLMIAFKGRRKEVFLFIVLYCIFFAIQFNPVTIKNKISMLRYAVAKTRFTKPLETSEAKPVLLVDSGEENKIKNRWRKTEAKDSFDLRMRGTMTGFFMGCAYLWTGVGVGQTRYFFDRFSEDVRMKAEDERYLPSLPFRSYIFTNRQWIGPDTGIFNIFMNAWAETGIFGFIAIIGILLTTLSKGLRAIPIIRQSKEQLSLSFLLPLFIVLILVHQTIYLWAHPWLWTVIALTFASADIANLNQKKRR